MYFEERWINLKEFFHYIDCIKVVRIRGYSGSYFPAFALITDQSNTEYGNFSRRDLVEHLMSIFRTLYIIRWKLNYFPLSVILLFLRHALLITLRNSFLQPFLALYHCRVNIFNLIVNHYLNKIKSNEEPLKVNKSRCKQCVVTPYFSTGKNLIENKILLRKNIEDKHWHSPLRKAFW